MLFGESLLDDRHVSAGRDLLVHHRRRFTGQRRRRAHGQRTAAGHGIARIQDQIHQHLLELHAIGKNLL